MKAAPGHTLDPSRCALVIQDMQNDVVMDGGAFAASGSSNHCREQNAISNVSRLATAARARGIPVIHVWFVVEAGCTGVTMNAPLFEGLADARALVRGSWGAAPVPGLEAQPGDHIVEKQRMSAWKGTRLETVLKAHKRHRHRHRSVDEHVDRAHLPHRGRQGILHGGAGGLLLDHECRMAHSFGELCPPERGRGDGYRRPHRILVLTPTPSTDPHFGSHEPSL
jgi:hypothetical protein